LNLSIRLITNYKVELWFVSSKVDVFWFINRFDTDFEKPSIPVIDSLAGGHDRANGCAQYNDLSRSPCSERRTVAEAVAGRPTTV